MVNEHFLEQNPPIQIVMYIFNRDKPSGRCIINFEKYH